MIESTEWLSGPIRTAMRMAAETSREDASLPEHRTRAAEEAAHHEAAALAERIAVLEAQVAALEGALQRWSALLEALARANPHLTA